MTQLSGRTLKTRRGVIPFPAYIPVTTFGKRFPLDELVRPYLPRLASAAMVSYSYARDAGNVPPIPLLVDSGGFASLFEGARVVQADALGVLEVQSETGPEHLHPRDILELQERLADVAFPLDFPIPPGMDPAEASRRLELTVANGHWALANRRRHDLRLFACVQAWDAASARACVRAYSGAAFDGFAIGGLVPRLRDMELVLAIVEAVRAEIGDQPLHVFGLGNPETVSTLFKAGVDSVDSSAYLRLAADGRLWSDPTYRIEDPSPTDRLHLALCNLATATGTTLPLSLSRLMFSTQTLVGKRGRPVSSEP